MHGMVIKYTGFIGGAIKRRKIEQNVVSKRNEGNSAAIPGK